VINRNRQHGNSNSFVLIFSRKKNSFDVKDAMRQLLNRHKKRLQENMHKVSERMQYFQLVSFLVTLKMKCTCLNVVEFSWSQNYNLQNQSGCFVSFVVEKGF